MTRFAGFRHEHVEDEISPAGAIRFFLAPWPFALTVLAGKAAQKVNVLSKGHPSVSVVDTRSWKPLGTIPLPPEPSAAVLDTKSFMVFDAEKPSYLVTLKGYPERYLFLEPVLSPGQDGKPNSR